MKRLLALAAVALLTAPGPVRASVVVSVNLSGAPAQSFVSDTLTLNSGAIPALTLNPGVPTTANTQTLTFFEGDSGATNQTFPFTLTQTVTINGVSHAITQTGQLQITPPGDTLTLLAGPTTLFDLGTAGTVAFTPSGVGPVFQSFAGRSPAPGLSVELQGTFLFTPAPVPEPTTLAVFGLVGAVGFGYARRRS